MTDNGITSAQADLSVDEQIKIALKAIAVNGEVATMAQIYDAIELRLADRHLSQQGKASLRRLINTVAVKAGYIYPHDRDNPGWRITPEGRNFLSQPLEPDEEVFNVDTQQQEVKPSNAVRGAAFELYVLDLLKRIYPHYTWYHQGHHKHNERGLDFIGERIGDRRDEAGRIGVQVKLHDEKNAPTREEWLKFLAGCFMRRVDKSIFVTSGTLASEMRREAGEAESIVVEGRREINRLAEQYGLELFELYPND